MPNTKDSFDEEASLLSSENQNKRFNGLPEGYYEAPIIKGVVSHLKRWPSDLFCAFLAACVIIGSLVFLIFVTVAVCLPIVVTNRVEEISILEIEASPNVYFLKLQNQNWSTGEFCYIETAARKHSDLNVKFHQISPFSPSSDSNMQNNIVQIYLINLLKEEPRATLNVSIGNGSRPESVQNDSSLSNHHFSNLTPEQRLRQQLVHTNANIRSIDASIDKFFKGSKLSTIAKALSDEILEIAAKAQLLWSVPGIALKPNVSCALDFVKRFLCNRNKGECLPDKLATIELENDIQATGVPCQAFMGFLVDEISKNNLPERYTLRDAVRKYCPRSHYCPEIRILDSKTKCSTNALDCPIVYSSTLAQDDPNLGNFVT